MGTQAQGCFTQEKNRQSTVLNPRRAKEFAYRVLLHGPILSCVHARCTRYFFQRGTSSEAVAIGVSKANPPGESVDCFSPLHSTRILTLEIWL